MARRTRTRGIINAEEPQVAPVYTQRSMAEKIKREGPPTFDGLGDPFAAERWIRALERIFQYIGCEDRDKLNSATYQLVDEADFWWESVRRTITPEEWEKFTWDDFKAEFFGKCIPDCFKQRKQNEFWNLRQGKGTVTEYDRTFNQLSRYAPHLVDTDEKRATRFRRGLKTEIAVSLASQGTMSYAQTLSRALDIEAFLPRDRENRPVVPDGRGKRNGRTNPVEVQEVGTGEAHNHHSSNNSSTSSAHWRRRTRGLYVRSARSRTVDPAGKDPPIAFGAGNRGTSLGPARTWEMEVLTEHHSSKETTPGITDGCRARPEIRDRQEDNPCKRGPMP